MNIITLMGRLGKSPETRQFDSGTAKVSFSVATTERYKNKQGEQQEDTQWHQVESWDKQGELIAKYFKKGDQILLTGQVRYSEKDGKYYTHIRLKSFEFIGGKQVESQTVTSQAGNSQPSDDLPF